MEKKYIEKINEFNLSHYDAYILEVTNNKIIVNNNQGLSILNYKLDEIKHLKLFEFKTLSIYSIFKKKLDDQMLLYSAENKCLIYIHLNNYKYKIIPLKDHFNNNDFTPLYIWEDDLILTDYKKNFYIVTFLDEQIKTIIPELIQIRYPLFYKVWEKCNDLSIAAYAPENYTVIVNDFDVQKVELINIIEDKKEIINYSLKRTHNFVYKNGYLLLIHEKQIELIAPDKTRFYVKSEKPWIYLRANFLDIKDCCFVILQSNNTFPEKERLTIYCIKNIYQDKNG